MANRVNVDAINRLIAGFVGEAGDLSAGLTRDILALERGGANLASDYDTVARGLHTLKGGAGTLGLEDLERLAHRLEAVLLPHQGATAPLPSTVADALLQGLDTFMFRVRAHAEGRGAGLDAVDDEPAATQSSTNPPRREQGPRGEGSLPPPEPRGPASGPQTWRVDAEQVIALMREVDRLRFIRLRLDERRRDLDRLRAVVTATWRGAESSETQAILAGIDAAIAADGEEAADVVEALEQGVKSIGTQPVRAIVEPLHRAVRDMCRTMGKEATLSLVGGDISLDRRVLDALRGPLVHLTRNAVAHGIEGPNDRKSRGKHEEGTIVIRVEQQGNVVFVEVSDDGGGLDHDAIRRAALERGVATEAELARMDPKELEQLIFVPTVSTARSVTATSGRGIGMDAVKKGVEDLHGQVEVQSIPGQGTRIVLTFPAGLGSSPILIVRSADQDVGIPMLSVEGIAAPKASSLIVSNTETKLAHQDELVPVVDLSVVLGLRHPRALGGGPLLLVRSQGRRVALAVDAVVGDMDLVIRPLPREVGHLPLYQGASSLARGELLLILRPDWLVGARPTPSVGSAGRNALVVDDSVTARALHRAMLEVGGYRVHGSSGPQQALEQLKHATYDVVICDLAMSPIGGIEFVRTLRTRADTRDVPIIVVSASEGDAARQQAFAAGADGFLSKSQCASGRLLAELAGVVAGRRAVAPAPTSHAGA
jgi:two-component system, chemotaxis family, sensor kinase CheA